MKRLIRMGLAVFICCLGIMVSAKPAWAYTEAQKRQAKAWLSAHGYPPTWDGAYQAYDDWLEGKWWDEFGSPEEYYGSDDEERPTAATQRSYEGERQSGGGSENSRNKGEADSEKPEEEEDTGGERTGNGDAILTFLSNVLAESEDISGQLGDMESLLEDLNREREAAQASSGAALESSSAAEGVTSMQTELAALVVTQAAEVPAEAPEAKEPSESRLPWVLGAIGALVVLLLIAVQAERRKKR